MSSTHRLEIPAHEVSRMRAGQLHEALALVDELPVGVARQVRNRIDPAHLGEIAQATRLTWVPIEYGIEIACAYHDVLGEKDTFNWGRTTMLRVTSRPWMRSIRDGAIRIFGLTPRGLFRFAPRFWDAVYRHSGELVFVGRAESAITIVLNNIPKVMLAAPAHLTTMSGAFAAAFEICDVRGEVWMRPITAGDRRCTFDLMWTEKRAAASL